MSGYRKTIQIKESELIEVIKKTISEGRQLILERPSCNDDWDCSDGKWCAPHPPCTASGGCWREGKGGCAPIRNDGLTIADDLEIPDKTVKDDNSNNTRPTDDVINDNPRTRK